MLWTVFKYDMKPTKYSRFTIKWSQAILKIQIKKTLNYVQNHNTPVSFEKNIELYRMVLSDSELWFKTIVANFFSSVFK